MKNKSAIFSLLLAGLLLPLLFSCKKEVIPSVTVAAVTNITANSATSGGEITSDGGAGVTARGVCWSTSQNPTTADSKTTNGTGTGSFTSSITGLTPGATYNLKAYAINAVGTAYSSQISFSTLALAPVLITTDVSAVTSSSVNSGGNITNESGSPVTARGVCWSTTQNPTIADSKTTDGTGSGIFTSAITGLTPGATYYIRAYATNSIGTGYGNQVTTTTMAVLPTITTTSISAVTSTTATSGGNITNDGGSPVTARGVCWSTTQNPTIADSKTADGTGMGIFASNIVGLTPGATYYIRAYASNSIGTTYGSQTTVTTAVALPTLITINATAIGSSSATLGGNIISNGGGSITESGIYFGTSANPETAGTKIKSDVTTNVYSIDLNDLLPNTTYYVKAYATNSKGISFGNQISFTTAEFKFGIIDVSQTTAWNYWVVAKDGSSYFVTLKNNKPVSGYFKPDKNKNGYVIYFDDKGLPSKMVIDNYVLLFTNFRNQLVDAAIISPNNDVSFQRDLKVNIDMSKFFKKGFTSDLLFGLGLTSDAIGIASCVGGIIGIASGIGAIPGVLLALGCASTVIEIASEIFPESFRVAGPLNKIAGYAAGIAGCASLPGISDCVTTAADLALEFANLANARIENPNIAEVDKILGQGFMVSTNTVSETTFNSAVVGGNVTTDGVIGIVERGVFYGTSPNPEITGTMFLIGNGTGNFYAILTGLTPNVTYYVKAYARSSQKFEYGNQITFKTAAIQLPTLTTTAVSSVTTTSATSGGNVSSDGGATVTARGVCWSTLQNPTTENDKTSDGTDKGSFTSYLTDLDDNTTYYVRAYATNSVGTAYGLPQISFKTLQNVSSPTVTTTVVTTYTTTSATVGGNITASGGTTVTERGVYWGTNQNPQTTGTKLQIGSGTGLFSTSLSGLNPNTTYYIKAYAINSAGTAFGTQVSFTTGSVSTVVPTITTTAVSSITSTTATSGGNITSDGGAAVTAKGVCWSTTSNPTTALSTKTTDGTGTGSFTSSITGLTANTTYYVSAYATNSAGTAYGLPQISFTTSSSGQTGTVTDVEGNIYNTINIGTQTWMAENLKTTKYNDGTAISNVTNNTSWAGLITGAYCWYNNNAATYKGTYGALYNWYTVSTGKLCPTGWHVPSDAEWTTLTTYLGGENIAGGKLKETGTAHWLTPNTGATNETGFTALPGGYRDLSGNYTDMGYSGLWWSSTVYSIAYAWHYTINYSPAGASHAINNKIYGFSVRCVRD